MYFRRQLFLFILSFLSINVLYAENDLLPPETWMRRTYEKIEADSNDLLLHGEQFLAERYLDLLYQYNVKRFLDFAAANEGISQKRIRIADAYTQVRNENSRLDDELKAFKDLKPTDYVDYLKEQAAYLWGVDQVVKDLEALKVENQLLLKSWKNRASNKVIDFLTKELSFSKLLHEPFVSPADNYSGYKYGLDAGYRSSLNDLSFGQDNFTFQFNDNRLVTVMNMLRAVGTAVYYASDGESGTDAKVGAAATAITFGIDSFRNLSHENEMQDRIKGFREAIHLVRSKVIAKEKDYVRQSIESILEDRIEGGGTFTELLEKSLSETTEFLTHIQSLQKKKQELLAMGSKELEKKLQQMIDADTPTLVNKIMKQFAGENEILAAFDREAWKYREKAPSINSVVDADSAYKMLLETMEQDAYFDQKYITGVVTREERDFFFNEKRSLKQSYPLGPWRNWLLEISDRFGSLK